MDLELKIKPETFYKALLGFIAFLGFMYIVTRVPIFVYHVRENIYPLKMFDLDEEGNIPSFFSAALLLSDALLLFYETWAAKRAGKPWGAWLGLGAAFAFLAFDEWFTFHELFNRPTAALGLSHGFFRFSWVIPYGILTLVFGLIYLRFWWNFPPRTRWMILGAAVLFVGGALGLEMVGGKIQDIWGPEHVYYSVEVFFEEMCEMLGTSLFLYALLDHIRAHYPNSRLRLTLR